MSDNFNAVDLNQVNPGGEEPKVPVGELPASPAAAAPVTPAQAAPAVTESPAKPAESDTKEEEAPAEILEEYAEYAEVREKMITDGIDMTAYDAKLAEGADFSEEEIQNLSKYSGVPAKTIEAHLKNKQELLQLRQGKVQEVEEQNAVYEAEVNAIAGDGGYKQLIDDLFEMQKTDQQLYDRVTLWNAALSSKDPAKLDGEELVKYQNLQKAILREMAEARNSKQPAPKTPDKNSDLGLLTQGNPQSKAPAPEPAAAPTGEPKVGEGQAAPVNQDPLKDNPLATYSRNDIATILVRGPGHPGYKEAVEVAKAKFPDIPV